jgi:flavin reductase (DIM6/NTAB) family NADH-FMN oxidoreductase RutF
MQASEISHHHRVIEPSILYFGTPVVLIGTSNEDGTLNLAPMSSAWWLGWRCMLGLARSSKTTQNIIRTHECVLNLPSHDMVAAVNRLARTTGTDPIPSGKLSRGYRYEKDKFATARLTPAAGELVAAPRAIECPLQLEARVEAVHELAADDDHWAGRTFAIEVKIVRIHAEGSILMASAPNRIDPDKWRPLIMSFQQFYGLTPGKLHHSTLGEIPEQSYQPLGARMG